MTTTALFWPSCESVFQAFACVLLQVRRVSFAEPLLEAFGILGDSGRCRWQVVRDVRGLLPARTRLRLYAPGRICWILCCARQSGAKAWLLMPGGETPHFPRDTLLFGEHPRTQSQSFYESRVLLNLLVMLISSHSGSTRKQGAGNCQHHSQARKHCANLKFSANKFEPKVSLVSIGELVLLQSELTHDSQ